MNPISDSVRVEVTGIVQGVGFRPFVYNLAIQLSLTGWVRNTSAGVEMELNGDRQNISQFLERLTNQLPPLARIDTIHTETIPSNGSVTFEILSSQPQPGQFLPISPDVAICLDCQQELFDPHKALTPIDEKFNWKEFAQSEELDRTETCLLYTSPSPRDRTRSRMPSSA